VKEVLRELSEREFPAKSREVAIEGYGYVDIEGYNYMDMITLIKTIGVSEPECYNVLQIDGNTSKLVLYAQENYTEDWISMELYGHEAYEVFISGDFKNYLKKENIYYEYEDDDDNDHFGVYDFEY
jgi:hypothetical protein